MRGTCRLHPSLRTLIDTAACNSRPVLYISTAPEKSAQSKKIFRKSRVLPDDNIRKLLAFAFLSPISDLQDSRFANLVHCKASNAP